MAITMRRGMFALAVFAYTFGDVAALVTRGSPAESKKPATSAVTPEKISAVHKQLETIAGKLETMLNAKDGALAHAKVGPTMKVFLKELQSVLKATGADSKLAPAEAMHKLQAAKQGLASLFGDLNSRQTQLMKEDNAQRESLLLGVLMTNQKQSIDKQLTILKNNDFSDLEVSKALVANHSATQALYVQAAGYLDAHPNRKLAPMHEAKNENPLAKVQSMLETRLKSLGREYQVREKLHKKKAQDIAARMKKSSAKDKHTITILQKREERTWKKWSAMRQHDIKALGEAVDGVKKGDMKAVQKAREALESSLQAMQSQTGGFLYLIQMGHRLMKRDCPYCAAQCMDKCHTAGKPYVQCLTDCADAGK